MNLNDINLVDLIAVLLVAVAIVFGWRSGFVVQALALAGFVVGLVLVIVLAPTLADAFAEMDTLMRTLLVLGIVAAVVFLAQGIGSALGGSVRRRMGRGVLGGVDNGAGAFFGLARGIFIVWLMGGLLALFPVPALAAEARQSVVLRALDTRLPSPVVLAAELGRVLEAAGLPDVFVGAPPPVEAPPGGPDAAQAEQIAAAARRSTVRVESLACGRFMTGSGFAITADHLVTNAHVVTGTEQLWISFDGSLDRLPAMLGASRHAARHRRAGRARTCPRAAHAGRLAAGARCGRGSHRLYRRRPAAGDPGRGQPDDPRIRSRYLRRLGRGARRGRAAR